MSTIFEFENNLPGTIRKMFERAKYKLNAHPENGGIGEVMIKDLNFVERIHYGLIDHENNSVIPNPDFIVPVSNPDGTNGFVFDFVADSVSLLRLNFQAAADKGLIIREGAAFGEIGLLNSYINPINEYSNYLRKIFNFYNLNYIPNNLGISTITSYEVYVNNFFKFIEIQGDSVPLTMTRYNTSTFSSVLNTGLAFSYSNIGFDADQDKYDGVMAHPSYEFFQNICMNMGFAILHNNPNVLLFDISSPANEAVKARLGLFNLDILFTDRFIKTYTLDLSLLYNNINIYYNEFVLQNPTTKVVDVVCGKTVSTYINLSTVPFNTVPHDDLQQLGYYIMVRNIEEGRPFTKQKLSSILKKAKYFMKRFDKMNAIGYINNEFKDQVWNKYSGYHDLVQKLKGQTTQTSGEAVRGEQVSTPSGGGYSGGSGGSGGGSSSGY